MRGGMTSHAAVVARGMGACCVSGAGDIEMNEEEGSFKVNGKTFKRGDWISIDGSTGNVYGEAIETVPAEISGDFERFMEWADKRRRLKVRTNADTPKDAKQAVDFGAEGIGLVRTEHMFFEGDKIKAIREMIVAKNDDQMQAALDKLEPMQQKISKVFMKRWREDQSRSVTWIHLFTNSCQQIQKTLKNLPMK